MRERIQTPVALLASLFMGLSQAADPPNLTVLGPTLTAPAADAAIPVQAGRFIPVAPASGLPIYLAEDRAYRVYRIEKGSSFTGVKWDAPADAEPEAYSWPDAKGPVYVILARGYTGTYSLQAIKNGKTPADPPEKDGAAIRIQILKGPKPPPVDPVDPTPTDPVLTPLQAKLKAAIKADAATAASVSLYAALYRNAAKSTVMDEGLTTSANLLAEMQRAVKLLGLPPGSLDKTARIVADELNTLVPKTNVVLDKPARDNIAAVFTRIAADLEVAGK